MSTLVSVLNRIPNDAEYKKTCPGTHESHIFLSEINPSQEVVEKYYQAVNEWNKQHPAITDKMKACNLALVFRSPGGTENTVKVMQSARYLRSNDTDQVVKECHSDADFFVQKGFSVNREKIEATAHIKVGHKDAGDNTPLNEDEIEQLKAISRQFTSKYGTPIPLSYNCNQDGILGVGLGYQNFLNVRIRNQGMLSVKQNLYEILLAITAVVLRVIKMISEFVSFTQLDHGWIDCKPEELAKITAGQK